MTQGSDTHPDSVAGRRLHFVGIGGCGMSGLALVASEMGATVTGSDLVEGEYTDRLRHAGIRLNIPHDGSAFDTGVEVIRSAAVPNENVELGLARESGAKIWSRGELLAQIAANRPTIAVAGTHGKGSTSGMIVHCLRASGQNVGFLLGADLVGEGGNARQGDPCSWLVVEADESDGTLLRLTPTLGVITSIDHDHVKRFPGIEDVRRAMQQFAGASGRCVWPPFDSDPDPERRIQDVATPMPHLVERDLYTSRFTWRAREVQISTHALHDVQNAAIALQACMLAGLDLEAAVHSLRTFQGLRRRLELKGQHSSGAWIFDDYAHHPTAILSSLESIRPFFPHLVAVFEPWGAARTTALLPNFVRAFSGADLVVLLPHREGAAKTGGGLTGLSLQLATEIAANGSLAEVAASYPACLHRLDQVLGPESAVLVMGCGGVGAVANGLLSQLPRVAGPLLETQTGFPGCE